MALATMIDGNVIFLSRNIRNVCEEKRAYIQGLPIRPWGYREESSRFCMACRYRSMALISANCAALKREEAQSEE